MIYNNLFESLTFIESCFDKEKIDDKEWDVLKLYSSSSLYDVKYALCELLANFPCNQGEEILLFMLKDSDYMIRACACDSLKFYSSRKTIDALIVSLNDRNKLVRGFAALSIGDIQDKCDFQNIDIINILKSFLKKEHSVWSKTAISRSLLLLGEYSYESVLLTSINNRYYTIRNFSLNLIIELIENNKYLTDKTALISVLCERMKKEKTICVKNCIEKLVMLIESKANS